MTELRKSPVVIPELGPLKIGNDDWQMLVRQTKAFCGRNPFLGLNPSDICFIIVKEGHRNRILLLPFSNRENVEIPGWVKPFSKIMVAFGYVKGTADEYPGVSDEEGRKFASKLEPDTSDVKLSVELDNIVGRPLYYVIMNPGFEYAVYKTPMENLFGILTPVTEESGKPEQVPAQETEGGFECRDCGLRFKSIGEAKRHTESNEGHEIFRLERGSQ